MTNPTETLEADQVVVMTWGLVACSVCAPKDMPREEIERQTNLDQPTGISSRWAISDEAFADDTPNPCECQNDPARLHYLLNC